MRRIIRNNPLVYPLYVRYINGNRKAVFPSRETQLHLTGFPRSANTYCYNVIKKVFPELRVSTHIHTIASIKLAFKFDVPVVVILRDPVNTVASLCVMKSGSVFSEIRTLLMDYFEYHDYVLQNIKRIKVLRFEDVVSSKDFLFKEIYEVLGVECSRDELERLSDEADSLAISKESSKPMASSSLPRPDREIAKKELLSQIHSNPLCLRAQELHRCLSSHAVESSEA